jgi:hypothetical protein
MSRSGLLKRERDKGTVLNDYSFHETIKWGSAFIILNDILQFGLGRKQETKVTNAALATAATGAAFNSIVCL